MVARGQGRRFEPGLGEDGLGAAPLDQRAHPPRRVVVDAGQLQKCAGDPRGGLADALGGTHRRTRVVAGAIDGEGRLGGLRRRLEADVAVDVRERQAPARVDHVAELRWQRPQLRILGETSLQRRHARRDIEDRVGIDVAERTGDDVAQPLDLGFGIEQSRGPESRMQVDQGRVADAADLQVGARGERDHAVAAGARSLGDRGGLVEREAPARSAHAHDQPVARLHGSQRAGTPALPPGRDLSHAASFASVSRMPAVELRRERQKPRRSASVNTRAMWRAAGRLT